MLNRGKCRLIIRAVTLNGGYSSREIMPNPYKQQTQYLFMDVMSNVRFITFVYPLSTFDVALSIQVANLLRDAPVIMLVANSRSLQVYFPLRRSNNFVPVVDNCFVRGVTQ